MTDIVYEDDAWRVHISPDDDPPSPEEWADKGDAVLVAYHQQFSVSVEGLERPEDVKGWRDKFHIFPLSAYIHGGVRLYLGSHKTCPWDSGQVGYVLVNRRGGDDEGFDPEARAQWVVDRWNTYLGGDVWGVHVEKKESAGSGTCAGCVDWEHVESLYGIYERAQAEDEAQQWVEYIKRIQREPQHAGTT